MSDGFRAPPTDTDLRPFYRSRPNAESTSTATANTRNRAPPGGDRPTRAPPAGDRSNRSASGAQWSNRSSSDWSDRASASSDWSNRPSTVSDWSSRPSSTSNWSSDGALSVLNSCGLDPSDLSLLAELPENMLTVKSLPHVLSQIKGHKKDVPPNLPGYQPSGSTPRQHIDQSQAQYQGPAQRQLPCQSQASYQGPGQSQAAFSSSSTGIVVDYGHRAIAPDFGKTPERPLQSSQTSQVFTAHGPKEFRRSAEINPRMGTVKMSPVPPSCPPSGVSVSAPSEKQARDFHGMRPSMFPYSCSLCDITVLSEIVWTQHINGTQHADGQLTLLQRFPCWDCRLVSASKSDSKQLMEASMKTVKKNMREKELNQKPQKKALKGKVVCVKFPPRSVDEPYLRKLIKPFGEKVNVAMFPSLGFIELESAEQAQNLISFYTKTPHTVNGQEIEFSISNTFNFLQSSFVVNFYPVPFGKEGQSDLLTVIKRFGTPLYTMFLPEKMQGFVEMQNAADAHKMVEFYSSTPLRINGVHINVSFSQEYRTLERCGLAKPYEEEPVIKPQPKRPQKTKQNQDKKKQDRKPEDHDQKKERSVSREKTHEKSDSERSESRDRETERRSREKSGSKEDGNKTETKKATEKLSVQGQNKDESGSKGVVNKTETKKTSEKPTSEGQKKEGAVKSASKDVVNNRETKKPTGKGSSGQNKVGSVKSVSKEAVNKTETKKTTEKPNSEGQKVGSMKSGSKEPVNKTESNKSTEKSTSEGQKREGSVKNQTSVSREKEQKRNSQEKTSSNQKKEAESKIEVKKKEQTEDTQELSEEGSDIEGMQVMGEHLDEEEEEERKEDEDEDPGFPFDLENCITLDEVHDSDEHEEEVEEDENSPRVVFIGKLPICDYSDAQFLQMVQTFAKPVRYFLNKAQRMGLVEMQSTTEAVAFCSHMKNYVFKGSAIKPFLSDKYNRLYKGWVVHYDSPDRGSTRRCRSSSRNRSKSPNDRESRSKWSKTGSEEMDKSRESDKEDTRRELTDQTPREKQSPTNQSKAVKEDSFEKSEAFDEEGWVVYDDLDQEEEKPCDMIRIENVVSLKGEDFGGQKDKSCVGEEEGWLVWNEAEETTNDERVEEEGEKKGDANKMAAEKEPMTETGDMIAVIQEERLVQKSTYDIKVGVEQESDVKMDVEERESNKMAANQELLAKEPPNEKAVDEDSMVKNGQDQESADEEGWPVSNLSLEEEFKPCVEATERRTVEEERDEQNGRSEDFCAVMKGGGSSEGVEEELGAKEGGQKAVKRRRSGAEAESGPEKKLKEDTQDSQQDSTSVESVPTESGTTETRTPNKPIGTEFIRFYCNLCHEIYADEHQAKVSHCSSLQHYQKYKEITGKDPWTS